MRYGVLFYVFGFNMSPLRNCSEINRFVVKPLRRFLAKRDPVRHLTSDRSFNFAEARKE